MWFGFVVYIIFAFFVTSTIWSLCGARSRKRPVILLLLGFLVSVTGVFLIWTIESYADTIELVCNKFPRIITSSECRLDKAIGGVAGKFIEVGFAALGAGLMGLAFDIKTKDDLDLKKKVAIEKLSDLNEQQDQWKLEFNQLGKDLDSLQPLEKVRRFNSLREKNITIFDKLLDAKDEVGKWN